MELAAVAYNMHRVRLVRAQCKQRTRTTLTCGIHDKTLGQAGSVGWKPTPLTHSVWLVRSTCSTLHHLGAHYLVLQSVQNSNTTTLSLPARQECATCQPTNVTLLLRRPLQRSHAYTNSNNDTLGCWYLSQLHRVSSQCHYLLAKAALAIHANILSWINESAALTRV